MLWSTRYISCISALWAYPILSKPTAGTGFVPRGVAAGEAIARRACGPAAPDVSKSSIIGDVCNQTLANDFDLCSEQLTVSIQKSAANTCAQYSGLFTDCLMANQNDSTACPDALLGYQDCEVYTLQAYAYCGCYYTLPQSIVDCANQQLQSQPQDTAMVPTTTNTSSTAIPSSPRILDGGVTADQEPTPSTSEELTPTSSPSILTSSDPRILANPAPADQDPTPATTEEPTTPAPSPNPLTSSDPRILSASSNNLLTTWPPNAALSTSSELGTTTVVVTSTSTYTSTFTPAASYTTTITSTATSTIYNTCADNDGISIGGSVQIPAATPALTPTTTAVIVSAGQDTTGTAETITIPEGDASSSSLEEEEEEQQQQQTASSHQEETPTSTFFTTFFSTTSPSPSSPPTLLASSTDILPPPPPPPPSSSATTMTAQMRNASSVSAVACKGCRKGRRRSRVFL